jgi:hypothetical protein
MQAKALTTPTVPAPTLNPVSPITLGGSVTASVTVTGYPVPTGSITFLFSTDNGTTWNTLGAVVTLSGGSATSDSYTPPASGSNYQFIAVYSGDSNYDAAMSLATSLTVNQASATVGAATFSPNSPITLGGSVTVSASVTGPGGVTAPAGDVQFWVSINGGSYANFGSPAVLSGSSASISYTPQTATTYNFKAVYQGDSNYVSGTTGATSGTLTVNKGTVIVPAPTLSPSGSTTVGTSETLSVTVSGGGATPSGTATFQVKIGSGSYSTIGSAVTLSGGSASTAYTPLTAGSYQFEVVYSGDSNYNGPVTGSAASLTVTAASASVPAPTLSPSGSTTVGTSETLSVTVSGGGATPSGTATFQVKIGSGSYSTIGSAVTLSGGSASTAYTPLTAGSYQFEVVYSGDSNYNGPVTGSAASLTSNPGGLDHFVFNTVGTQTAGTAFTVTVTAKDAYNNTVTGYTGTPSLTYSAGSISPTTMNVFVNGVGSTSVGVTSTGSSVTITATDGTHTGISNSFAVNAAAGVHFVVSGFPSPTVAGVAHSVTVTAKDAYNNTVTGYVGVVKITSSDSKAVLPASAGLTSGVGSFSVTLETVGSQSITATDTTNSSITGSQTGITVNAAAISSVAISPANSAVTAGLSKTYSATASDAYGNTWDVTSSTTWSTSSGAGGSWNSNVYTSATAGSWIVTGTYGSVPYTTNLTVNPAGLGHFVFNTVGTQTAGTAFTVTVTAKDAYNNTVTGYTGSPSLMYSAGSISPGAMNAFVSGVGSTSVAVIAAGSGVAITATDGNHAGTSNSFTVTIALTPTPTSTATPKPTPTPTPTPSPTSTPSATVPATTDYGAIVYLAISGNVTSSQISNATITSYLPTKTTTVSFTITGPSGTAGFGNMTIPKTAIYHGTSPVVYIDGLQAPNQGYAQDGNNFYVWFTTSFSAHQVSIQFVVSSTSLTSSLGPVLAVGITVPEIISIFTVIAVRRLGRKPDNA